MKFFLKSYKKKNNKLRKTSRRFIKNGGGKKEDLIKQIGDIIDEIYSREEAACYGSQWCNAPGPHICADLERQQKTLVEEFKSEFPEKELYDALDLRRRQREEAQIRRREQERYQQEQERELQHKQWMKRRDEEEKLRLEREFTEAINAYKTKIERIPKNDSSLEEERADLEMWFDKVVKSCRDEECWKRKTKLYNEQKKILQPHLDKTPSGQRALQRARERKYQAEQRARAEHRALELEHQALQKARAERRAIQKAIDDAAAEQRARQKAIDDAAAEKKAIRDREIAELKMASASFGKILSKKRN
jgi:hypothetical protein